MPKRAKMEKKKKVVVLTPAEKFEQLIALKKATRCILNIEDEYKVYVKLAKDFAELGEKAQESPFEGSEQCAELSEECRKKAEALKAKLPKEHKRDSQTVMTTARERGEKKSGPEKKGRGKWILLIVAVLIVAAAVCWNAAPTRYYIAGIQRSLGRDSAALKSYAGLGDYKDSAAKKMEMKKVILGKSEPGQTVSFGKCRWFVLDKKDGRLLLAKNSAVSDLVYHEKNENVTWENSSLRSYLNRDFIQKWFSPQEQELIAASDVRADTNKTYGTKGGKDCQDRVFIMSSEELQEYKKILGGKGKNMRLRTPGKEMNTTAYVSYLGECVDYGVPVNENGAYIRPVMWIQYE